MAALTAITGLKAQSASHKALVVCVARSSYDQPVHMCYMGRAVRARADHIADHSQKHTAARYIQHSIGYNKYTQSLVYMAKRTEDEIVLSTPIEKPLRPSLSPRTHGGHPVDLMSTLLQRRGIATIWLHLLSYAVQQ